MKKCVREGHLSAYNSSIQTVFIQNNLKMFDGQSLRCSDDDKERYETYIHHWIEPHIPWQYVLILVNAKKTCSVSQEELHKHRLFHFLLWHSWPLVKRISSVTTSSSHCRKKKSYECTEAEPSSVGGTVFPSASGSVPRGSASLMGNPSVLQAPETLPDQSCSAEETSETPPRALTEMWLWGLYNSTQNKKNTC